MFTLFRGPSCKLELHGGEQVRKMSTAVPRKSLKEPEFLHNRKVLLALTVLNITIYVALLIPLPLNAPLYVAVFSVLVFTPDTLGCCINYTVKCCFNCKMYTVRVKLQEWNPSKSADSCVLQHRGNFALFRMSNVQLAVYVDFPDYLPVPRFRLFYHLCLD